MSGGGGRLSPAQAAPLRRDQGGVVGYGEPKTIVFRHGAGDILSFFITGAVKDAVSSRLPEAWTEWGMSLRCTKPSRLDGRVRGYKMGVITPIHPTRRKAGCKITQG